MIKAPNFHRFPQWKNQIISRIVEHKILVIVLLTILISLIIFSVLMIMLNNYLLSQTETGQATPSSDIYYATVAGIPNSGLGSLLLSNSSVSGVSDDSGVSDNGDNEILSTPTPFPTETPEPTIASTYIYSPPSCAGTPTVDNSEVYVSSSSTLVNNAVTITVELLDCNNNYAPVSDNLTVTLSNSDSGARINGSSSSVTIQAQNGKATFSVSSSNAGTDTFVITDTSRSFPVTTPGYHNPSVTFSNNSSGNSNCTTAAGTPNSWYSDVYPNPPISTTTGSITLIVDIRDCNYSLAPVADTLNISVSSGDPSTQVNGGSLPQNVVTQNGEASFTVSSQVTGTVTLVIQDTTSSFTVTDKYSHNPSINFNGSSTSTPTDTPTPTPTTADTPTSTPIDTPSPTATGSGTTPP